MPLVTTEKILKEAEYAAVMERPASMIQYSSIRR